MHRLRIQQYKVKQVSFRLKERDKSLFQTCVKALREHKKDKANVCANEAVEVKKLIRFLYHVELTIERVIIRLETLRELSDIVVDLKPALGLLQRVSKGLFEILPDVSSELGEINDTISETLYLTRVRADESLISVNKTTPGGEEIIKEVTSYLEQELAEKFPEPPVAPDMREEVSVKQMVALASTCSQTVSKQVVEDELASSKEIFAFEKSEVQEIHLKVKKSLPEDVLLDYVRKSKGNIDLAECSQELNASYSDVESALKSLKEKGKIVVEKKVR